MTTVLVSFCACGARDADRESVAANQRERVLIKLERYLDAEADERRQRLDDEITWAWNTPDKFNTAFRTFVVFNEESFKSCVERRALTDSVHETLIEPMQLLLMNTREMLRQLAAFQSHDAFAGLLFRLAPSWAPEDSAFGFARSSAIAQVLRLESEVGTRREREDVAREFPRLTDGSADSELRWLIEGQVDKKCDRLLECGIAPDMKGLLDHRSYDSHVRVQLASGQEIRLPAGMAESVTVPLKGKLHTVREGESLWDIARAYHMPVEDIVIANGLDNGASATLHVGSVLEIPATPSHNQ